MSTSIKAITSQDPHNFSATNLTQSGPGQSCFLKLPAELIQLIGEFSSTGNTSTEAAKNAVYFGRVSALTHLITHKVKEIESIISLPLTIVIDEVIDAAKKRRIVKGTDIPRDISEGARPLEDKILIDEHINLYKTLYRIFKRTASPANNQNLAKFVASALEVFNEIIQRVKILMRNSNITYEELINNPQKVNLILSTFCIEIINDILLVYANSPRTMKQIFLNEEQIFLNEEQIFLEMIKDVEGMFKKVRDFRGFRMMKKGDILEAIEFKFKEISAHIDSLHKNKKLKIELEIKVLENELQILRGPNHFDGAISDAYRQKLSAQTNGEIENEAIFGKLFDDLLNRLNQIARFDDSGRIIGGKLAELYSKLSDLKEIAKEDPEIRAAGKLSDFLGIIHWIRWS